MKYQGWMARLAIAGFAIASLLRPPAVFGASTYERNLEDFGFSTKMEEYRQEISLDFQPNRPTVSTASNVPSPVLPKLQNNYSDLVPPPTKPRSRRYFQPRLKSYVPGSKEEFQRDRIERIRDYNRPPDFNLFLQDHSNVPQKIFGNTEFGLTGLYRTVTAETLPKSTMLFFTHFTRIRFDRSFGERVNAGKIDKFLVPIGLSAALNDQFEVALTGNVVNEQSINFPLINDYEKTELEELMFMTKYQFLDNPSHQLKSAFGFGVQAAQGKQVTRRAADGTSYMGYVSVSKAHEKATFHAQLGINIASGKSASGNEHPNNLYYNLGVELPVSSRTRIIAEMNGLDWAGFGNNVDFTLAGRYQVREEFSLQLALPVNIIRADFPQNYSSFVSLGLSLKI